MIKNRETKSIFKLLDITRLLAARHAPDVLLDIIIDESTKVVNADRGTIFLLNKTEDELWSYIAQDIEINEIRLPLGVGIAGKVAQSKKPMRVREAYKSRWFFKDIDRLTGYQTRSLLCVPMSGHTGRVLGVLEVLNKKSGFFTKADEKILSAFADHAALAIENARILEENMQFSRNLMRTLVTAIEAKDPATAGHSERVTHYALRLGRALRLSKENLRKLEIAAYLHDVGKIGIRDRILLKKGKVTEKEYEIIKGHSAQTKHILEEAHFPEQDRDIPEIAYLHHERVDGKGYPLGLEAGKIPLLTKILTIADFFDAMTASDRSYKNPYTINQSLEEMKKEAGKIFDKKLVRTFIQKKLYVLERRGFVRIDGDFSVEYQIISPDLAARADRKKTKTKNISGGGLLLNSREFVPLGTFLLLNLLLPDMKFKTIGKVVRVIKREEDNTFDLGISFENLSKKAKIKFQNYLTSSAEVLKRTLPAGVPGKTNLR